MRQLEDEENPFDAAFGDDDDDDMEISPEPPVAPGQDTFAVLNSSLPEHHLASYAIAKSKANSSRKSNTTSGMKKTRWHFGIRSCSSPMEIMLEIYRTLKLLGMEWKEKKDLGGLGGVRRIPSHGPRKIERNPELDSDGSLVDLKAASQIYFVETRARVRDVVVLMNIQLYMIDHSNYLVDFVHKGSYRAAPLGIGGRFDKADTEEEDAIGSEGENGKEEPVISPYLFMDVACKLILELAGAGGSSSGGD